MNFHSLFRSARSYTAKGLFSFLAATVAAAYAQPAHVNLPAAAHGAAAIAALGEHLPEVAKAHGLDAQELATLFRIHPSMGVDIEGGLMFVCEGLSVELRGNSAEAHLKKEAREGEEDALGATSSLTQISAGSTVDALKLHSLPGVNRVIYLDFDGHTTSNTSWNSSYVGGATIVSGAFDLDGDPSTFNADERGIIQRIWQRVAEDYAPYAVDVTTEDPGVDALRKSTSSDTTFGIRVVASPTNWYKSSAGGVASIGSFSYSNDHPCFVFTGSLANSDRYIADAISHEVGHTLGLYHDGASGASPTEYYYGQGDWAPIMGVGYYKNIGQFSRGDYADANNTQDDLAIISTYIPYAADDHGNTLAAATILSGPVVGNGGTIESVNDRDVFRIDAAAGPLSLNFVGLQGSPNLDIKAELLSVTGNVLQATDPDGLSATLAATLGDGTYYVRVSGVGAGDVKTTGYSAYGSIGNYLITGSFVTGSTKQAPKAVITVSSTSGFAPLTVSFSGQSSTDADGTIAAYNWSFGPAGATAVGATASYTYTTTGSHTAVLTVTDNDGLLSSQNVTITVNAPSNVAPVAIASASATSGVAPLAITFSSTGSSDSDGTIASYSWNFGDGTSSTSAAPSKSFSSAGNYAVKLTVTDDRGATASSTVNVSVTSDPNATVQVQSFVLTSTTSKSGTTANATVTLQDTLGRSVSGVAVTIQWSGVVSGTSTSSTGSNGVATMSSPRTKKVGTITGTIIKVGNETLSASNTLSSGSGAWVRSIVVK